MEAARRATPADTGELVTLAEQAAAGVRDVRGGALHLVGEALAAPYDDSIGAAIDDPACLVLVGTFDGVPVGLAVVRDRPLRSGTRVAAVELLYVMPDARAVGVGEAMMDSVLAWAAQRGCVGVDAVALPGDRATKNFFELFGLVARAIVVHRAIDATQDGHDD